MKDKKFVIKVKGNLWNGYLYFKDLPILKSIKESHFKTSKGRFSYCSDIKSATTYNTIADLKKAIKKYDLTFIHKEGLEIVKV